MANDQFDPKKDSDNWDDAPKINWDEVPKSDWSENQKNDGGSGNNYYRRYTSPSGGDPGNHGTPGQAPRDVDGSTSKTIGIVGLIVTFCFCQLAGIVMGIIGYNKATQSIRNLGYESSDASVGRVLGIVNIVLGALLLVASIASLIFTGVLTAMLAGEGVEAWNFNFTA